MKIRFATSTTTIEKMAVTIEISKTSPLLIVRLTCRAVLFRIRLEFVERLAATIDVATFEVEVVSTAPAVANISTHVLLELKTLAVGTRMLHEGRETSTGPAIVSSSASVFVDSKMLVAEVGMLCQDSGRSFL